MWEACVCTHGGTSLARVRPSPPGAFSYDSPSLFLKSLGFSWGKEVEISRVPPGVWYALAELAGGGS